MPLELYAIGDDIEVPDDPGLLPLLGTVTMQEHGSLTTVWAELDPPLTLPYAEDSRLDADQVVRLHDRLRSKVPTGAGANVVIERIVAMLDVAISQHAGIATFCD